MEKQIQVYIIKQKIMRLLSELMQEPEGALEHKTIIDFADALNKFLFMGNAK